MATTLLVEIDGEAVADADLEALLELRVEEATGEADAATLLARVDASAKGEWRSPLDALARPRTPLAIELTTGRAGYRFEGYSAEAGWDLDAQGDSRLTVKAVDKTLDLDADEKVVTWPGTSDSAIAEAIFADHGFDAEVEATPKGPDPDAHVAVQRATDWVFLRALAAKWGYATYLECSSGPVVGHFHSVDPLADAQGVLSLAHGGDAYQVSVQARLLAGQRVRATRLPALASGPRTGESQGVEGAQGASSLGGAVGVLLAPGDVIGEVEPDQAAQALARRAAFGVTLSAEVDGERLGTLLRARRTVLVRGLGELLSGQYLVDRVRHVVTRCGHRQQLTLTRNALGLRGDEAFAGAGPLAALGGL